MIAEERKDSYSSDGSGGLSRYFVEGVDGSDITFETLPSLSVPNESSNNHFDNIKGRVLHRGLQSDLIGHMWEFYGSKL